MIDHKISTYILIAIGIALLLMPQYHGWGALADIFATWRNDGMPAEAARCAAAFKLDME